MIHYSIPAATLALLLVAAGAGAAANITELNDPIRIASGQQAGDLTTVNGDIDVGDGASVRDIQAVNGEIRLGGNAAAASIHTVNGDIDLGERSRVEGGVHAVNGEISLGEAVEVRRGVANVNGEINLRGAYVGGGITTMSGDIDIGPDSRVEGGLRVEKPDSPDEDLHLPRIVIGPRAVVEGTLVFEREVELYVSDSATIGPVEGATPVMFSGERP